MGGVVEVGITEVGAVVLEVGGLEDVVMEETTGLFDVGGPPVVGLEPVVVPVEELPEDLQAEASETDARATPAPVMTILFRNRLLEYWVTR